mmetsp:Transcript_29782/g.50020  ORF Transcript_29782/g.50020 Transcript_29782/m.50020 type:complete len:881 (-) Transcript_29782:77-2719(-)
MANFRPDVALGLLLCTLPVMVHGFDAMGGYTPVSDVSSHSKLALDICEIERLVAEDNYDRVREVYHNGLNAAVEMRNLNTLAERQSTSELWAQYSDYHKDLTFIDKFIETALDSWETTYGANKGKARQQVVKKGSRDILMHLSIIDELDAALVQLKKSPSQTGVASGAPSNWDKAWAYYYGSQDTKACGAPYNTVQDRAKDFGTQEASTPLAHKHILAAFLSGQEGCRAGDAAGIEKAVQARAVIVKQLRIPAMQGVLKYSNSVDNDITADASSDAIKHQAEAWVFLRAIAAQLHLKDPIGAAELTRRLDPANAVEAGNYVEAYCALDLVLPALDTSWDDIGRYSGTPLVDCKTRTVVESAEGECSIDQLTEFTTKCRMVNASSVVANDAVNLPAVCNLKYDAVRCVHDAAFLAVCKLPKFGLPTEVEEASGDRRRSLLSASVLDAQINTQLGFTVVNTLDCCSWYDVEFKVEVYSDRRRRMLSFRELLEKDVCEDCHYSFCKVEEEKKDTGNKWFSVPALFILYRETLEAAIIIAVLLQFMDRTGNKLLKKWVWIGAMAGVGSSIALGVIFISVYYITRDNLFSGDAEYFFEGAVSLVATVMITVLAFCMLRMWNMQKKWELKLAKEMANINASKGVDGDKQEDKTKSHVYTVFSLSFSAVFREGVESVVFLAGIGANTEATAIPIPGLLGVVLGIITGLLVFRGGDSMKTLKTLFTITFVVLLVIAAGIFTYGTHEFQETGMFGAWKPMSARDWQNEYLWDISDCCSHKDNDFFALMRALVGYTATPTFVEAAAYLLYWSVVVALFVYRHKNGTLVDKDISKYEDDDTQVDPMCEISPKDVHLEPTSSQGTRSSESSNHVVEEGKGGERLGEGEDRAY